MGFILLFKQIRPNCQADSEVNALTFYQCDLGLIPIVGMQDDMWLSGWDRKWFSLGTPVSAYRKTTEMS